MDVTTPVLFDAGKEKGESVHGGWDFLTSSSMIK